MKRWIVATVVLLALAALVAGASSPARKPAAPPAAGRDTARVRLGGGPGAAEAFVANPRGSAEAPAVILVHEWWGLNGQIRGVARRLAREGYVVIVPDLYHGKVAEEAEDAHALVRGLDEGRAVDDLAAAAAWLRSQPRTARSRIGVIGFCMGGRLALLLGLRSKEPSAVVMFYGTPETAADPIATLRAPLQGHFGGADRGIEVERVAAFDSALAKAGKVHDVYVYPGAGHAFMNEARPSYNPDAARLAWARTLAFLQRHLKG